MNQILEPNIPNQKNANQEEKIVNKKKKKLYKIQLFLSSIIASISLFVFAINSYRTKEKENLSKQLLNRYSASTLYANTNSSYLATNVESSNQYTPFVIGMIKIDKINLNYPILSYTSNELLEISLCRFAGPMPNKIGNLCIAGHNYVDYKFFSRLHELEIGNKIKIYDLSGQIVEYIINEKYETTANDLSCTSQETNNQTMITLLTCNNVNGKRLIIKAK